MKNENPRRGGNAAGAVGKVVQQIDSIAPLPKFQPHVYTDAPGLDAAMERDRAFFRRHPFLSAYTRELMPDEFPPSIIPVPPGYELRGTIRVERISAHARKRTVLIAFAVPGGE
jgi:hypothetical protein